MAATEEIKFRNDGFIGQRMVYLPGIVKKRVLKDTRVADLYITHIGIFPKALGHLRKRIIGCSQYILLYCVDGEGWVELEGRETKISANQMFIIPPKTVCRYGAGTTNPWTIHWLHFTGENAGVYTPNVKKVIEIPPSSDSRIEDRLGLFEEMLRNMEDCFSTEKVIYANIVLKYFLSSVKYLGVYRLAKTQTENDLLKQAISYMKNNLGKNIRISDLAELCQCSTSNIYKIFKQNMNSSPQDFFIHLKMEKARKYLLQTNMKVKEIGLKLGYDDPYYFSRIFKIHTGESPATFRKEEK